MFGNGRFHLRTLTSLWSLIPRSMHLRFVLLLIAMLVAAALELVSLGLIPLFLSFLIDPETVQYFDQFQFLDQLIEDRSLNDLMLSGSIFILIMFIIKGVYVIFVFFMLASFVRDACIDISMKIFHAYMKSNYKLHLQRNTSTAMRNMTGEIDVIRGTLNALMLGLRELVVFVFIAAALLVVDPITSLSVLTFLALCALGVFLLVRPQISRSGQRRQFHRGQQIMLAQQSLGALKVAKVLGHEDRLASRFDDHMIKMESASATVRVLPLFPRVALEAAAIGVIVIIVVLSIVMGRQPDEIIPLMALISVSVIRLVPVLITITAAAAQLSAGSAAVNAVTDDLKLFQQRDADQSTQSDLVPKRPTFSELAVKNISFTHPGASAQTLKNISVTIRSGQSVGLMGATGAGKTTLADMIMGLGAPDAGNIELDGQDIYANRGLLSGLFGYVPQDIYLLDDTLKQNIGFGIPADELDDADLEHCLQLAQLTEFVKTLPHGVDTLIGERGARLSGGQRQRLGIARALYHRPAILVFDEATSALDGSTEEALSGAIQSLKGTLTILTIAHRLSTLENCDVVYRMEAGEIVAVGELEDVVAWTP